MFHVFSVAARDAGLIVTDLAGRFARSKAESIVPPVTLANRVPGRSSFAAVHAGWHSSGPAVGLPYYYYRNDTLSIICIT